MHLSPAERQRVSITLTRIGWRLKRVTICGSERTARKRATPEVMVRLNIFYTKMSIDIWAFPKPDADILNLNHPILETIL